MTFTCWACWRRGREGMTRRKRWMWMGRRDNNSSMTCSSSNSNNKPRARLMIRVPKVTWKSKNRRERKTNLPSSHLPLWLWLWPIPLLLPRHHLKLQRKLQPQLWKVSIPPSQKPHLDRMKKRKRQNKINKATTTQLDQNKSNPSSKSNALSTPSMTHPTASPATKMDCPPLPLPKTENATSSRPTNRKSHTATALTTAAKTLPKSPFISIPWPECSLFLPGRTFPSPKKGTFGGRKPITTSSKRRAGSFPKPWNAAGARFG
mmetsp:Transcript_4461/g.9089  ORF Transcript_4461/g.9089 Transcript_4461/m.9089 type:complete len:262 (+) Transcript_4461:462-1247(+)